MTGSQPDRMVALAGFEPATHGLGRDSTLDVGRVLTRLLSFFPSKAFLDHSVNVPRDARLRKLDDPRWQKLF